MIVALVILAVPPMLTNAYVAVDGVDPEIVDAARGMGMRGREVLLRVELPLALPLLFAGIRTAAVYVVATATLAAIDGRVGRPRRHHRQPGQLPAARACCGAAICVAALALLVEGLFAAAPARASRRAGCAGRRHRRLRRGRSGPRRCAVRRASDQSNHEEKDMTTRSWIRSSAALMAVALAVGLAACGSSRQRRARRSSAHRVAACGQPGKGKPAVTLGDKNFTEQYILGRALHAGAAGQGLHGQR